MYISFILSFIMRVLGNLVEVAIHSQPQGLKGLYKESQMEGICSDI